MTPTPYAKETYMTHEERNLREQVAALKKQTVEIDALKQENFELKLLVESQRRISARERVHVREASIPGACL